MIKHPEQKSLILSVHVLSDLFFNYTSLDCDFLFFFFITPRPDHLDN